MTTSQQTCPSCGLSVKPDETACSNCGVDLNVETPDSGLERSDYAADSSLSATVSSSDSAVSNSAAGSHDSSDKSSTSEKPHDAAPTREDRAAYCPQCGHQNLRSNKFCVSCGEKLQSVSPSARDAGGQRPATAQTQQRSSKSTKSMAGKKKKSVSTADAKAESALTTTHWLLIGVTAVALTIILMLQFMPGQDDDGSMQQNASGQQNAPGQQGAGPQGAAGTMSIDDLNSLKIFVDSHPEDAAGMLKYANALHDFGSTEQAIVQYRKYLELQPDDPDARVDMGICFFELKQYPEAIIAMERVAEMNPGHQLAKYNLGIVNLNAGNREASKQWFEKAVAIDPSNAYGKNATQILEQELQ